MNDECFECKHPPSSHKVQTPGDPMSYAPCTAAVGPPSMRLTCDCDDYDGMTHPDRPSLGDTMIWQAEDGGLGWVVDPTP